MKRFMKTCGSIVLAASMMLGVFGVIPASAAETKDTVIPFEEFQEMYKASKIATDAVASMSTIKAEDKTAITILGGDIVLDSTILRDPKANAAHATVTADLSALKSLLALLGVNADMDKTTLESYIDIAKGRGYTYDADTKSYLMDPKFSGASSVTLIDKFDLKKFNDSGILTITGGAETKVGDVNCQVANLKISATGEQLAPIVTEFNNLLSTVFSGLGFSSAATALDLKKTVKSLELTISLYTGKDNKVLVQTGIDGSLTLDTSDISKGMMPTMELKLASTTTNSVSTETVTIPDEWVKKARLVAGITVKKNGIKAVTTYSGKSTVFSVNGVTKTSAKKLTIPASISSYGKSYKVTTAAKNAFKKAKKLKTLVVKNATLKKLLKKSPTKYGLKKSVKIK